MSTPLVDIPLPYGATMESNGTRYLPLVKPHRDQMGTAGLKLPEGPCRVSFSWAENVLPINVYMHASDGSRVRSLGTIPTGGGDHGAGRVESRVLRAAPRRREPCCGHYRRSRGLAATANLTPQGVV